MQSTEILNQLVLRLARLASGSNDEIDQILDDIRRAIHGKADARELAATSENLAKVVLSVTGQSTDIPATLPASHDLSGLSRIIKGMPLRGDDQKRFADLARRIAFDTSNASRQQALAELLSLATESLKEIAARQPRSEGGVLGLFGRRSTDGSEYQRFLELFSLLVHRLVEHIDVINGSPARSKELRDALGQLDQLPQAEALLREVTREIDSIDSRVRQERHQINDFLGVLRERLDDFGQLATLVTVDGERTVERSAALQSQLGSMLQGGLDAAVCSGDLEAIRRALDESLHNIAHHLTAHVEVERQQFRRAQAQVEELSDKLARLDSEAEVLRAEIRAKTDLALKDPLTGVYNRNGFEERVAELHARWQRSGAHLSIVFVDCNKFKHINDTYGHAAGDLVLIKIAEILHARARVSDVVCRFGGDEFVVLLPDTRIAGAETFAISAFNGVLDAGFNDNGKPLDVSISLGITELREGDDVEAALARADAAMYEAKGRQGVRVAIQA